MSYLILRTKNGQYLLSPDEKPFFSKISSLNTLLGPTEIIS